MGLLVIYEYYVSWGELYCDICLILFSVYGINVVLVVLVGMCVVVVDCYDNGDVDFDDLCVKVGEYVEWLLVLMIIYLFIYGVYEYDIVESGWVGDY